MSCGCAERKEIMFTRGRPGIASLAVLVGIPAVIYVLGRVIAE